MLSYLKPRSKPTTSLLLIWLMLGSLMLPMVGASSESANEEIPAQFGDLSDFSPEQDGHAYIFNDEQNPVYSAFGYLKKQWIENGYPNLIDPFAASSQNSRSSNGTCSNAWQVDDTDTFPHLVG